MEFLQSLDLSSAPLLICGSCVLCLVGGVLLFGLQIVGGLLGAAGDILEVFVGLVSGGPAQWCGCLGLIFGIGICAAVIFAAAAGLSACETNPTNFCTLFGR
ncbi:hypothetical protein BAC2_01797 [uncultured bacterium]|nr:hypothetical protein BAC2_01797 [uncultured bacterium]